MKKLIIIIKVICACAVASLSLFILFVPASCFIDFSESTLKWIGYTPLAIFCACGLALLVIIFAVAPILDKKDKTYERNKLDFYEKPTFIKETIVCRSPSEISSGFDSEFISIEEDSFICTCGYFKKHRIHCCVIELKSTNAILGKVITRIKEWRMSISENEEISRLVYFIFASSEDKTLDRFIDDKTFEMLDMSSVVLALVKDNTLLYLKYNGIYPLKNHKTRKIAKNILLRQDTEGTVQEI